MVSNSSSAPNITSLIAGNPSTIDLITGTGSDSGTNTFTLNTTYTNLPYIGTIVDTYINSGESMYFREGFVRDVEFFGEDILTSIRNLMNSTPSENLKEFLEGLVIAYESGGSLKTYLSNKSEHFREQGRRQLERHLKTLEILSEVYVSLFVAMPIFLIVMISAMSLLGKPLSCLPHLPLFFHPCGLNSADLHD